MAGLFLDGYNLTGTLPASFPALNALPDFTALGLGNNPGLAVNITLLAPFALVLTYLSLGSVPILGGTLPAALGAFTALTTLQISSNGLTGTLPPELGALTALAVLGLSDNGLFGSIPDAWAGMTSLAALTLGNNALSGSLPASAFCNMALTRLDLSTNALCVPALWILQPVCAR
jgi:Leucine-rich repeat (LRR) protein